MKEIIIGKNRTTALHTDDTGFYQSIRELVVAVVTSNDDKPIDWAAYSAFIPCDMDIDMGKEIIAAHGDKLYHKEARAIFPELDKVWYRN